VQLARRQWPGQGRYRLSAVAERLGIAFRHHDAGEDAFACAEIALAALRETGAPDLTTLAATMRLARARFGPAADAA
jgi:DNA polymerase-3 subunit epsilon